MSVIKKPVISFDILKFSSSKMQDSVCFNKARFFFVLAFFNRARNWILWDV
jgi:hypothetical protein